MGILVSQTICKRRVSTSFGSPDNVISIELDKWGWIVQLLSSFSRKELCYQFLKDELNSEILEAKLVP
ncbi:hypothetical protein [Peribacillus sp. FSL E2-0159]|uniref:hypothetical protein n=1 Tax=Peribacillus sp. FSL E2-0159 TaxID=2975289 RepID=UPI00315A5FC5